MTEKRRTREEIKRERQQQQKAKKTTNKTITEIAYETGFNSASYFNKSFFKQLGVTPNLYRKKN